MRAGLRLQPALHEDPEGPALASESLTHAPLVVAVVGPTASGKTDLALCLAARLGGEVVSADMGQLYRGFDAGTAKPPRSAGVHLVDVLDPAQPSDAGSYARLARPVLDGLLARGRLPIVAGGTGLYVRALLEGLSPLPPRDPAVRARLEAQGAAQLHAELARRDPAAAARIDAKNPARLVRALEVIALTGRSLSEQLAQGRLAPPWRVLYLALEHPRPELRRRIRARAEAMFPAMVDEVRRLVPGRLRGDEPAFRCLGYPQALACARGDLPASEGLRLMVDATNAYARRQLTWFRRQTPARWLAPAGGAEQAERLVRESLP
ncbi:MAG: tRNA (adenosine(37)-N6)-dimethylallyltransferase MiaA [Elusimicrobia bacterium]|nr:tRNA (adenosine(37)-N6)-dimethylallyltransferase MiaA [Elusimicrobiota bacterium]